MEKRNSMKTFAGMMDGYACYLDCGDGFISVKLIKFHTLTVQFIFIFFKESKGERARNSRQKVLPHL